MNISDKKFSLWYTDNQKNTFSHNNMQRITNRGYSQMKQALGKIQPLKQTPKNIQSQKWTKTKNNTKEFLYALLTISGIGITGLVFFNLGDSLFKKDNAKELYDNASKLCKQNDQVKYLIGEGCKTSYGRKGTTRGGLYTMENYKLLEIHFHVHNEDREGIVTARAKKNGNKIVLEKLSMDFNGKEYVLMNSKTKSRFGF
jgi:hypothetical protein